MLRAKFLLKFYSLISKHVKTWFNTWVNCVTVFLSTRLCAAVLSSIDIWYNRGIHHLFNKHYKNLWSLTINPIKPISMVLEKAFISLQSSLHLKPNLRTFYFNRGFSHTNLTIYWVSQKDSDKTILECILGMNFIKR